MRRCELSSQINQVFLFVYPNEKVLNESTPLFESPLEPNFLKFASSCLRLLRSMGSEIDCNKWVSFNLYYWFCSVRKGLCSTIWAMGFTIYMKGYIMVVLTERFQSWSGQEIKFPPPKWYNCQNIWFLSIDKINVILKRDTVFVIFYVGKTFSPI